MNRKFNVRLIHLSGSAELLRNNLERQSGEVSLEILQLNERDIIHPRKLLSWLRSSPADLLAFGCQELTLQRYQLVLAIYLLCGRGRLRMLIDERGESKSVSLLGFLVVELPRFVAEVAGSVLVLARSWAELSIRLFRMKQLRRG